MRRTPAILAACMAFALTGCVLRGKAPKTAAAAPVAPKPVASIPAPPPAPLSIPQTRVELPKPQSLDPAALVTEATPPPPAEAPPATARPLGRRSNTDRTPAANTAPAAPPAALPAVESAPQPIQEILTAGEKQRLKDSVLAHRRDTSLMLEQLKNRTLNPSQQSVHDAITSFAASSVEAENNGDMRQADALAERAWILAKGLVSGK